MNRDLYKAAVWLAWLALPITALNYWKAWDRLPMRMAVHFDANWQPNGYTSRDGALMLGLGIMVFMLIVATVGALSARALKRGASWPLLAAFYVVLGFVGYANYSIIEFNLKAQPAHSELVGSNSLAGSDSNELHVPQRHL